MRMDRGVITDILRAFALVVYFVSTISILAGASPLTKEDIVLHVAPVEVTLGRSVFIHPSHHLRLRVDPGDSCTVTVMDNDPLTLRVGQVIPMETFPCQFDAGQVKYQHYGSRVPNFDVIKLLIRYDSPQDTLIIPVTLHVHIQFQQLQLVSLNVPLATDGIGGTSNAFSPKNTRFVFDSRSQVCQVSVLAGITNNPLHGRIANDSSSVTNIDCEEFLTFNIRYQHNGAANSPNTDYIPMVVQLFDKNGAMLDQENFQKLVRIGNAASNRDPEISLGAYLIMEAESGSAVNQFILTPIPPHVLSATDPETDAKLLVFNITAPLGPGEGHIVSTDDRYQPITSFFQGDVQDLKIAYQPPVTDSAAPRNILVDMVVVDADGGSSPPFSLMIVVNPKQTMSPIVTVNKGIQLFEGQSRSLSSGNNLVISDEDNLGDVKVYIDDGARHGEIIFPNEQNYFTPHDLDIGAVVYQHDGSDGHYSDNIIFRMDDGDHLVIFLFPVTIYPIDDEPPQIITNTGLKVNQGEMSPISQHVLYATDIDSNDLFVTFSIVEPYSSDSLIILRQSHVPSDPSGWQYVDKMYEKVVKSFTQMDLLDGLVFYKHTDIHANPSPVDRVTFTLADNHVPPNYSQQYVLLVEVAEMDRQAPYLYPGTPLWMEVEESQLSPLRRKFIRYSDDGIRNNNIQYLITRDPFDTDGNSPLGTGDIVMCENPRNPRRRFTQGDINYQKICYKPSQSDLGVSSRMIQFEFTVADIHGNSLEGQMFTILIKPTNNKPPQITNAGFDLPEGGSVPISPPHLDVVDIDTPMQNISFVVTVLPMHGTLKLGQQPLIVEDQFKKSDLNEGFVQYFHDGGDSNQDEFYLEVTDGAHVVPVRVPITIQSNDDESPASSNTESSVLELDLHLTEMGDVTLNANHMTIVSPANPVTFTINDPPSHGTLSIGGINVTSFTDADLVDNNIVYFHHLKEIGQEPVVDRFTLVPSTQSQSMLVNGNKISEIVVKATIHPVDNKAPVIILGAMFEVLEGEKSPILPRHLDVLDVDTNDSVLQCIITSQPQFGYVENVAPAPGSEKSRRGLPVTAFFVHDLRLQNVNYVQSIHKGVEERSDSVTLYCSDGVNISPPVTLSIHIIPQNDEKPVVYVREFSVMEGMEIKIDTPLLMAVDGDIPVDTLTFYITEAPKHGQIVQQQMYDTVNISAFTMEDIATHSNVMYRHDNSETTRDSFSFIVTDGVYNTSKTIALAITPLDDETPRLRVNNGIRINSVGQRVPVTNKDLQAQDIDSFDPNITIIIRRIPRHGYFLLDKEGRFQNMSSGSRFTQADIDGGFVFFQHTGTEGTRDLVTFDITDGLNTLVDRYFYITIVGVDIIYPVVISKGVQLPEGGSVTMTTDVISGSDINSPDENLVFTVTMQPQSGFLETTDRPGVPIVTFTQRDLAGSKIRYVHTSDSEVKMDHFNFEVTDGTNSVNRVFRIAITDVDNKKPVLALGTLYVSEGHNKIITPFEVKAIDQDSPSIRLTYTITQVPLYGNILYNLSREVTSFTQHDIDQNLISYQHGGTETASDNLALTVTDGFHSDFFVVDTNVATNYPQSLHIQIIPVDNRVPQMAINRGVTSLNILPGGRLGVIITNSILKTEDRDSPPMDLTYTLTVMPRHGYLLHSGISLDKPVNSWTQRDIDEGKIQYLITPGANVTADTFFFQVADTGGNILDNQPFHLKWCYIYFGNSSYLFNETDASITIHLHRRGYLGETSYISIVPENGTAGIGEDVSDIYPRQVQFNPGEQTKTWTISIMDNGRYETRKWFHVRLSDPVMASLQDKTVTVVTIQDPEDESFVNFSATEFETTENVGDFLLPLRRYGDLSDEFLVICETQDETAIGNPAHHITTGSDFISRPNDQQATIRFEPEQSIQYCPIRIIDDSLYEGNEKFKVILSQPVGGRLGNNKVAEVTIIPDVEDEPVFHFEHAQYNIDESGHQLEVTILRTGTDLSQPSSVSVRSRQQEPVSAKAQIDYKPVDVLLSFGADIRRQTFRLTIVDDLAQPSLEGEEEFLLVLRSPMGAALGSPSSATVTIDDSVSDLPSMQFKETNYYMNEEGMTVLAVIVRTGDLSFESSVRCYTRQDSAHVGVDYVERPDTDDSLVSFVPGESEKDCLLRVVDDTIYEKDETMQLVLGSPWSPSAGGAHVGANNSTTVWIRDIGDKPVIRFAENQYTVNEPVLLGDVTSFKVKVIRIGDLSQKSMVRVFTKDGSATANRDYVGFNRALIFEAGTSELSVDVQILFDTYQENVESFSIHISDDQLRVAQVKRWARTMVYIEENSRLADVVFPTKPIVVSLKDYNRPLSASVYPPNGYPLVCITPCNFRHPEYGRTGSLCHSQEINDTLTRFTWKLAPPTSREGVTLPLKEIEVNAFFASKKSITLDSIYFNQGHHVQCVARAVHRNGDPGRVQESDPVIISTSVGMCPSRVKGLVGADPYSVKLRYIEPDDNFHANQVQVKVIVPHRDSMVPVISTRPLNNFFFIMGPSDLRVAQHGCSNLLDFSELPSQESYGFINNSTRSLRGLQMEPNQYNPDLRGEKTLRFYRNLDLSSCVWEFTGYFEMVDLVNTCGAFMDTVGQPINGQMSEVKLHIPLFVSYVFPNQGRSWTTVNSDMDLVLRFVYSTTMLWDQGISAISGDLSRKGFLYPTKIKVSDNGTLVVNFRTEAKFRGQFVSRMAGYVSSVTSPDHPEMTFTLNLIRSDSSYDEPAQDWQFVSNTALLDYSGFYHLHLVPCTAGLGHRYQLPLQCKPDEPITFQLPIKFQQTSDPVSPEYTLNTKFYLLNSRSRWISETPLPADTPTSSFLPGDTLYGRIEMEGMKGNNSVTSLAIEKIFVCSGKDGYIPSYKPENQEFGCLSESEKLEHSFKILDLRDPETVVKSFKNIPFNAQLASDDASTSVYRQVPWLDGFSVNTSPILQDDSNRMWFIHAVYTIGGSTRTRREAHFHSSLSASQNKRSHDFTSKIASRLKRGLSDLGSYRESGEGNNMVHIVVNHRASLQNPTSTDSHGLTMVSGLPFTTFLIIVIIGACLFLILCVVVVVIFIRHRRKHSSPPPTPTSTMVVQSRLGKRVIVHVRTNGHTYGRSTQDKTEV